MARMGQAVGAVAVREQLEAQAKEHGISVAEVLRRRQTGQIPSPPIRAVLDGVGLREHINAECKRLGITPAEYMALQAAGQIPPPRVETPRCTLGCFVAEILDAHAVRELDPTLKPGAVVRLDAPFTERTVVARDGHELLAFVPTDGGQPAADLSWSLYLAVLEALGHREPLPDPSDAYVAEAEAWAREALAEMPVVPMAQWLGRPRARRAMVVDRLLRSFLLPPVAVVRLVGQVEAEPLPSLWPLAADARRIDELRRDAAERAAREAEERARVEAAKNRVRTPAELGAVLVEIRTTGLSQPPAELGVIPPAWRSQDGRSTFHLVQQIAGVPVPILDMETFRIVPPSECIIPPNALPPTRPSDPWYALAARLIEIDCGSCDTGPVSPELFRFDIEAADEALLDELARVVTLGVLPTETFRRTYLPRALVAGRLLHPAIVDEATWDRVTGRHAEAEADRAFDMPLEGKGVGRPGARLLEERTRNRWVQRTVPAPQPLRTAISREDLGRMLVQAAAGGLVRPGALLSKEVAPTPNPNHRHQKKNPKKG